MRSCGDDRNQANTSKSDIQKKHYYNKSVISNVSPCWTIISIYQFQYPISKWEKTTLQGPNGTKGKAIQNENELKATWNTKIQAQQENKEWVANWKLQTAARVACQLQNAGDEHHNRNRSYISRNAAHQRQLRKTQQTHKLLHISKAVTPSKSRQHENSKVKSNTCITSKVKSLLTANQLTTAVNQQKNLQGISPLGTHNS